MNIEILKSERAAIIEHITENVGADKVKQVMELMVKMLGWNGLRSTITSIELADYVIETFNIIPTEHVNTLWGKGCKYSTQAEYQRSCMGNKWN
jgi:hypothetical protein